MSQKSNRRSFVDLAEAVRTLNVDKDTKKEIVTQVNYSLVDEHDFDSSRFAAHALSDLDGEEGKWAYNRSVEANDEDQDESGNEDD